MEEEGDGLGRAKTMKQSGQRARPGKARTSRQILRSDIRRNVTKIEGKIGSSMGKRQGEWGAVQSERCR